ncbi:MAG: DUF4340 domain-containing protein [Planctomycetota bacterium]|nr:MAG: DUF4340 domain-containing protein [Planctomycetota bacterium]
MKTTSQSPSRSFALPLVCASIFVLTFVVAWILPAWTTSEQRTPELGYFGPPITDTSEAIALARSVRGLTIQRYDHEMALLHHFEVTYDDARGWIIPSHHGYPADGGDRVGRAAGSVLGIERHPEARVSSDPRDHAALGVLNPDDEHAPFGAPRGRRVTLTGADGAVILDLIIGNRVDDRSGWRYLRLAHDDAVYQAQIEPDLSTHFTDYVEQDLLKVARNQVSGVVLDPHRVDLQAGNVMTPPTLQLNRQGGSSLWTSPQAPAGHSVDADAMRKLLDGITRVRLQGVRPLQPLTMQRMQRFGFFTDDGATIYGYEGGIQIQARSGLRYSLYFGERAPDDGLALTAGLEEEAASMQESTPGSNRFMIVLVDYDEQHDRVLGDRLENLREEAEDAGETEALDQQLADLRAQRIEEMEAQRDQERDKFLQFFYVISGSVFDSLNPDHDSLFVAAEAEEVEARGSDPEQLGE